MSDIPLYLIFALITLAQATGAKTAEPSHEETVLWLARSCTGEAGWRSYRTGECAAILHVYRKRSKLTGETTVELARRYSAAIKQHDGKRNKWALTLRVDGGKPERWPNHLNWDRYRGHWVAMLIYVDFFLREMVPDPLPRAMHYGCKFDIPPPGSVRIKTKFRNRFYR